MIAVEPERIDRKTIRRRPRWDYASAGAYFSGITPKKGSLSTIIHRDLDPSFAWQACFCDHIIRGERDVEHLRQSILLNPITWQNEQQTIIEAGVTLV